MVGMNFDPSYLFWMGGDPIAAARALGSEIYGKQLVQVGFMRRYDKGYRALKHVIDNGRIGEALMVHCVHRAPSAPGCTGDMALTDSFPHEIDVLRWLLHDDLCAAKRSFQRKFW